MNDRVNQFFNFIKSKIMAFFRKVEFNISDMAEDIPHVYSFTPISELLEIFKVSKASILPVVGISQEVIGVVTVDDLSRIALKTLNEDFELLNKRYASEIIRFTDYIISKELSLELLTGIFTDSSCDIVIIVDETLKYSGKCVTLANMITYTSEYVKPRSIGGIATPLGVYITDGCNTGGPGVLGLISVGIVFSLVVNAFFFITFFLADEYRFSDTSFLIVEFLAYLIVLRLSPLVKIHAAEHKTIYAMEKGLELTLENVKNQPKEHPRCGSNLVVLLFGLTLLYSIYYEYLIYWPFVLQGSTIFIVLLVLISSWKKAGMWVQKVLTTVNPTDKQLLEAIESGNEVLQKYRAKKCPCRPSLLKKIWNMGLIQVLVTFWAVTSIVNSIINYFWPM